MNIKGNERGEIHLFFVEIKGDREMVNNLGINVKQGCDPDIFTRK